MPKLSLSRFVSFCRKKNVLLLTHENADLDSFASATIMQNYLKKKKITSFIGVPHHINEQALNLALKEKINFYLNPDLNLFDLVILFDFNHFEQLGKLRGQFECLIKCNHITVIAFDHHEPEKGSIAGSSNTISDASCVSTTQMLLKFLDKPSTKQENFLNCIGILADSNHFVVGDVESFESFSNSLKLSGRSYSQILSFSRQSIVDAERVAFLRAAQRSQIININGVIVVVSELSFYQSAAAFKLLEFGAHISLVVGKEKDGLCVLSARAESEFVEKNKFNLVRHLLVPLQEQVGGSVGGHAGAAQWKGFTQPKRVLSECILILKKVLQ